MSNSRKPTLTLSNTAKIVGMRKIGSNLNSDCRVDLNSDLNLKICNFQ